MTSARKSFQNQMNLPDSNLVLLFVAVVGADLEFYALQTGVKES